MSILIVGGGEIGSTLASRLATERKDVILIESSETRCRELRESADIQVICGSGAQPGVLRSAGLEHVDMLIAVTASDEVNLVACLVAAQEAVIPTKIARVRDPDLAEAVPGIFGAHPLDLAINPEEVAARDMLEVLRVPGAAGVFEFADGRVQVVCFAIDGPCAADGVRLSDLRSKLGAECNIVAVSRRGKLLIPDGSTDLREGDRIYAAGQPDAQRALAAFVGKKGAAPRSVVINGGGNVAYYLARMLEERELAAKIIEPREERCKFLVEHLERSVVIQGTASDPSLLREERIGEADVFVSLTGYDEENVLSGLLAKRAGASRVVSLINRSSYAGLVPALGIDAVVSPNLAAVSAILQFIRRGKVLSVTTIADGAAEALEIVALETSEIVGRPLRDVGFRDTVVGAIVRGEQVIIPSGDDEIRSGDRVVLFALRSAIPVLERQMMVKLEYF
ncbi:MAG: Trk system potassium transporter TrkA [Myxococcales bacterium]|nr:Trk system potassium transporter TrkA [Myxococcales bacterium]